MAATSLDNEFLKYWAKLTAVEKALLLTVAQNYVQAKGKTAAEDARMQLVMAEREAYIGNEGKSFSPQQVAEMARHKEKRHEL